MNVSLRSLHQFRQVYTYRTREMEKERKKKGFRNNGYLSKKYDHTDCDRPGSRYCMSKKKRIGSLEIQPRVRICIKKGNQSSDKKFRNFNQSDYMKEPILLQALFFMKIDHLSPPWF